MTKQKKSETIPIGGMLTAAVIAEKLMTPLFKVGVKDSDHIKIKIDLGQVEFELNGGDC